MESLLAAFDVLTVSHEALESAKKMDLAGMDKARRSDGSKQFKLARRFV